jgi:HAD superfamily hydrolase (TIGR01662 family)
MSTQETERLSKFRKLGKSGGREKTLWVREPYLGQILAGLKTVEVRVGYENIRRLQPGDRLRLNDRHLFAIRRIGRYADFEELLAHEDPAAIAPDLPPDQLLAGLRQLYPPEREALGAVALEVAPLPEAEDTEERRRYTAVLFDMGYTLVDFEPSQEAIVQEVLRTLGVERTVAEIDAAVRTVWGEYFSEAATASFPATEEYDSQVQIGLNRELLAQLDVAADGDTLQTFADALESWFSRPGVMHPYPEVVDVLTTLRGQGYRLGIISNWGWNLRDHVVRVALDGFFELVWASAYAGCNKPHPGIFFQALVQMDLSARRTLYVGDSYRHDITGARHAGLDVVLLDRTGTADAPDCPVIQDLRGLLDFLVE